jgi:hypothetical protein
MAVLSGSFSGRALDSRINAQSPTPGDFDESIVTGTFRLAIPDDYFNNDGFYAEISPPSHAFYILPSGSVRLTFDAAGQHVEFGDPQYEIGAAITLHGTGDGQAISLGADYFYPYWNAFLNLAGPANGWFDNLDLATLRPGPVDMAGSSAGFFAGRSFGAFVLIDQVSIDGYSVPEPPVGALMLAGVGGWLMFEAGARRRRSDQARQAQA